MYHASFMLFLVLLTSVLLSTQREPFYQQTKNLDKILTSNRLNYEHKFPNKLMSIDDKAWDYVFFKLNTQTKLDVFGFPGRVILSPLDQLEQIPSIKAEETLPPSYFFTFTSQRKKKNYQCGYDFQNKTIGYFDRVERQYIESILYAYRIRPAKLVKLSLEELTSPATWDTMDMVVACIMAGSPYAKVFEQQELALLSIRNILFDRIRLTNPYYVTEEKFISDFFSNTTKIQFPEAQMYLIGLEMRVVIVDKDAPGATGSPQQVAELDRRATSSRAAELETFISRLDMSPEFYDPNFQCVGDDLAVSKYECESPFNPQGEPKMTPSMVDKPCKQNEDCPFYKANKNYPNDFGRCMPDGKCQMPLGVLRFGYRTYYSRAPYQPFCYQCKDPNEATCCETQALQAARTTPGGTFLKSADYAFPDDTPLRKLNNLPLYIRLPKLSS